MSMYEKGSPYKVDVKKDEATYICQCGFSKNPPFCDGSHKEHPPAQPLAYTAQTDEAIYVCGCGRTGNKPFCDGSHNQN